MVIDSKVRELYGAKFPCKIVEISSGEADKTLEGVAKLASKLLEIGANRESFLLIVGGGATTDLGGFVASIFFRGVEFAYVPTTLLAQVDASLGGKNGVNLEGYKNILGTINQPQFTLLCPQFLESLNREQLLEGVAELLKAFIIGSKESFLEFGAHLSTPNEAPLSQAELLWLSPFAHKGASIKAKIVEADQFDRGERKLLNLGHTFAHAIEKLIPISHGKAVAIGICMAAKLSNKLSLLSQQETSLIISTIASAGLPTSITLPTKEFAMAIRHDKKRAGDFITFILIENIGKCTLYPINISALEELINDLS